MLAGDLSAVLNFWRLAFSLAEIFLVPVDWADARF